MLVMLGPYHFDINADEFVQLRLKNLSNNYAIFLDLKSFNFYLKSLSRHITVPQRNHIKHQLPQGNSQQWVHFDLTNFRDSEDDNDFGLFLTDIEFEKDERVKKWVQIITTTISRKLGVHRGITYDGLSGYAIQESASAADSKNEPQRKDSVIGLINFGLPAIWSSANPNASNPSAIQTVSADPNTQTTVRHMQ